MSIVVNVQGLKILEACMANFAQLHRDLKLAMLTCLEQAVAARNNMIRALFLQSLQLCIEDENEVSICPQYRTHL